MGDFFVRATAMTLEEYRALDAAGKITHPITWPPRDPLFTREPTGENNRSTP